ncbi:hypothetical protein CG747_10235 [Streptomyces sp. CB02959]|uniref:hypothetical protein n=1 Tax=Streptomyces sp. CB02959 TaxID=2020330 RepID=UPI000C27B6A6|nr:hypothetical protein [Streptomyces sp. CB02959]PJN40715.1 hypothetical protein CG747_10235 [Streptomyces sp. CB02959]
MIPRILRPRLLHLVGRADEHWYWLYQSLLCRLDTDPRAADAMYDRDLSGRLATCDTATTPCLKGRR